MMKENYSNFLKVRDGEQIFYSTNFAPEKSNKSVLVFNYGLVCSNHHWIKQIEYFDQLGYKILIYDYRGHFQSSGIDQIQNITFKNLSLDLEELFTHLNLKSSILLGHSMGVNVCLEFAKDNPELVSKLVLISGTIVPVHDIMLNTHLTGPIKPYIIKLLKNYPTQFKTFWKLGGWNPLIKKLIHVGGFNVSQVSDEFIEIYLNKIGQLGPELFFQLIDEMQHHDIIAHMSKITAKTLVIGGNKDKVIPNYLQRLMASKIQNSELYTIHEGSHVPQVDFPTIINERIQFFLDN